MAVAAVPEGTGSSEDVFLCQTPADYDGLGSRAMIAVALHSQLEALAITPTELLYGSRQLKLLLDQRTVIETALWRIATFQGRLPGQEPRARRAALQMAVEAVVRRTRAVDALLAEIPRQRTITASYLGGHIQGGAELGPALARAVVARDLAGLSGWGAKFEHLFGLVWQQVDEPLHEAVDELLGDLLSFAAATRDLLPAQASPAVTLVRLLEVIQGRISPDPKGQDRLAALSPLFRQNRLPVARAAVLDRICRQLRGSEPLTTGQPAAAEAEALRRLTELLITAEGVLGGGAMAEALTRRHARRSGESGARALRRAIAMVAEIIADLPGRVHYLAAICNPTLAGAASEEVAGRLETALTAGPELETLVFRTADPAGLRASLSRAAAAVAGCGLPPVLRGRLSSRVERLVDDFAASGELVSRLRGFEPRPAPQAWRLSELVHSGLVGDARALAEVRRRLFELLRLPGFNEEMAALRNASGGAVDFHRFQAAIERLRQTSEDPAAVSPRPPAGVGDGNELALADPARPGSENPTITATQLRSSDVTMTVAQPPPRAKPSSPPRPAVAPDAPTIAIPPSKPPRPAVAPDAPTIAVPPSKPPRPAVAPDAPTIAIPPSKPPRPAVAPDAPTIAIPPSKPPRPPDCRCPNCFGKKNAPGACPECDWVEGSAPRSPVHLPPGTWLLTRYRTGKLLGQGGFGATYLGWDDRLQIRVAVKEYFPTNLVSREPGGNGMVPHTTEHRQTFAKGISKFLEEARTLARLRDIREIVSVQDYFEDNGTAYLVMELLQGMTMKKYIADQGGKIEYKKALSILMPIMKALHSVHEQGMVHRDVSPDNIFMPGGGGAKLLDFGAARATAGEAGAGLTVILKPGFAPPEQYFSDSRQGPWTDIYALGATFYCAITGKPPQDSTRRLQEDGLQPPSAVGVAMPPEIERVLMTALALRRQDRYQSMREMIGALGRAG